MRHIHSDRWASSSKLQTETFEHVREQRAWQINFRATMELREARREQEVLKLVNQVFLRLGNNSEPSEQRA
jgi:hypothetical protein